MRLTSNFATLQDEQRQRPRANGINDPRLGTIDRQYNCETCEEGPKECPGHFGHIELASPVFHIGRWTKALKALCRRPCVLTLVLSRFLNKDQEASGDGLPQLWKDQSQHG